MTATQAKWTTRIAAWRVSGKTAEAFAQEIDCAPATLRWWSSQLVKREKLSSGSGVAQKPTVRMARVVRTPPPRAPPGTSVVVEIGRGRIELQRGVDRELLREVFAALGVEP